MRSVVLPPRGLVTVHAWRDGHLVEKRTFENAFTTLGADAIAKAFGGAASIPSLLMSHIGFGCSNKTIVDAEAVTGWSNTPVLDTVLFRQGLASLKRAVALSTTVSLDHATLIPNYDITTLGASAGYGFEFNFRADLIARLDQTNTEFHIFTGGTTGNGWKVSLANAVLNSVLGGVLQDSTWIRLRVPFSVMTAIGAPNAAQITGAGIQIATNAGGTCNVNWDDFRATHLDKTVDLTVGQTVVPGEYVKKAVTFTTYVPTGTASATVFLTDAEGVAQYDTAGLYISGGTVLAAVLPFDYFKQPANVLTVTWTLNFLGSN